MEWILEAVLVLMLAATLFHAVRLERALGVLKRDRVALQELVDAFNASTRQAEQGVEQLRSATEGAGRQIARQIDAGLSLKDDLSFLIERGERLADRLDQLVRAARPLIAEPARVSEAALSGTGSSSGAAEVEAAPRVRSQAERDLLRALRMVR
ncbi:MAG: hypothetical protein J0H67_00605 [Rhodospirillales bacterium]|nr:hypothetical protein [Rhodospirillales bacterium]